MPRGRPTLRQRRLAARSLRGTVGLLTLFPCIGLLGPPLFGIPLDRLVSPRPAHWVLDTTSTLSREEIARIDAEAEDAHVRTGGEIVVVVVDTTDGQPANEYAVALANRWLVGDQAQRNGILLLLAITDRRAEIALGKGIDGTEKKRIARELMDEGIVPHFQQGAWAAGLLTGVEGAGETLLLLAATPSAPPLDRLAEGLAAPPALLPGIAPAGPVPEAARESETPLRPWFLPAAAMGALALLLLILRRAASRGFRRPPAPPTPR